MYYLDDGLLIHDQGGAWAWFRLSTRRHELLSYEQLTSEVEKEAQRQVALTGHDCHQIGVPQHYDVEAWIERLIASTPHPTPAFEQLLEMQRERVQESGSSRRVVYLGVKLEEPRREGLSATLGLAGFLRQTDKLLDIEDLRPRQVVLDQLRQRSEVVRRKVLTGYLEARPATSAELRWLLMRSLWRGLGDLPEPERRETWGGEARALFEGAVIHNEHRWLRIEQPGYGEFYVASVGIHHFPDELQMPGGEWLNLYQELPFPAEYSVRYRVLSQREASKAVAKTVRAVMDQKRHIEEIPDAQVPRSLEEKVEVAQDLEYRVKNKREPLVDAWGRLIVTGSSAAELEARLEQLVEYYHDEIELGCAAPTGDQLGLLKESIPGQPFQLRQVYPQRMSVNALAGSGSVASTSLGDGSGPYLGVTSLGGDWVHFDPHLASRLNLAPLIGIFGRTGSGKSNLAYLIAYFDRLRGATVVLLDPKEEANGLALLCQVAGRVNKIRLGEDSLGMLDPFRIIRDRKEAAQLASTMLRCMLPQRTAEEVEDVLVSAANQAANLERPCLADVVQVMDDYTEGWGRVKAAVGTLRAVAEAPLGRVCFSTGEVPDLDAFEALTLLQFRNLPLPEEAIDPLRYTQSNRTAVSIVHAMTAMANRIVDVGTPEDPKLLIYDEAQPILANPEGRASLERFTVQGRSKGIVPVILSQNTSHMIGKTLRNNLGCVFVFELTDATEAEHACGLLGIDATEQNVQLIQSLAPRTGDGTRSDFVRCLMRDSESRVGMMQPDLQTTEIRQAFDTTPGSRFGLRVIPPAEATGE